MKTNAFLSMAFTIKTTSAKWTNPAEKKTANPQKSKSANALLWLLCQTGSDEYTTFFKLQGCLGFSRKASLSLIIT
jgi:hypothetical protein